MIQANELRIRNNVFDKDGNKKTVFAVLNNGVVFDSNQYIGTPIEWIKSIPLTEEWLIKFGFKEIKNEPIKWFKIATKKRSVSLEIDIKRKRAILFYSSFFIDVSYA